MWQVKYSLQNLSLKIMIRRIYLPILSVLVLFGLLSCNSASDKSKNETAGNLEEHISRGKRWKKISPYEIKNAIELFNKDWMALAVGRQNDMNAMTISWGEYGELWGRPVVTVYVSSSRYTHGFMERNRYFTVTAFPEKHRSALSYIGSHSGRNGDKLKAAGLTPEYTELGNPIFKEASLAIECKIIYSAPFNPEKMDKDVAKIYDNGMGIHTMYIGEIINVLKTTEGRE